MATTQSAYEWLRSKAAPRGPAVEPPPEVAPEPTDAHVEIDRLREEIADLVGGTSHGDPRRAVGSALDAVARLQVVTANLDASRPPHGAYLERALVSFADRRLQGHADAIERGMTYTADNTMRLLRGG
jgi:hypothetical protein